MVIDLVMVTAPKPPGSSTLISPPAAGFEIAPAKVLHGAVRLQGSASLPTPETQVRVACAWAGAPRNAVEKSASTSAPKNVVLFINSSSFGDGWKIEMSGAIAARRCRAPS